MYFSLTADDGLAYDYHAPARRDGFTLVCFNPLTGDKSMWQDGCGTPLIDKGHGLLSWNLRGQAGSPFTAGEIHDDSIVDDASRLLHHVNPPNPVFVGLSVGGLYAAKTHLRQHGLACRGFVLINTLREIGPRLSWINGALLRLVETGGLDLLRDAYSPLLMNEDWLEEHRHEFLKSTGYQPIAKNDGAWQLLDAGAKTEWTVDWRDISVPVLNITGLQDHIFRDDEVIARLLNQFHDVTALQYADAGHMVPVERPHRLAKDIHDFVGRLK